jgi:AcrR family transcriptional regulator
MIENGSPNKQRILEAAQNLFYKQGYNATSFSDIARAAKIPRGNFYYYFMTKHEIFESVVQRWLDTLRATLEELNRGQADPRERLVRFVRYPLLNADNITRYGCPFGTLNSEMGKASHSDRMRSRARELFDLMEGWLEDQFRGLGYAKEAPMLALQVLGRLQGAALVCNAYQDERYMRYEVQRLEEWIRGL